MDQLLALPPPLACAVLRELSEDIFVFSDHIATSRVQELRKVMALSLPISLPFVTRAASQAHIDGDIPSLRTALSCLISYLSWARPGPVFESGVPSACVSLLPSQLRDDALAGLIALVCRSIPESNQEASSPETPFREALFPQVIEYSANSSIISLASLSIAPPSDAFPQLLAAFSAPPNLDPIEHEFRVQFYTMLAGLGNFHFVPAFLFPKRGTLHLTPEELRVAAAFIDLMLSALSGPSVVLRLLVLPFFSTVLNSISKQDADIVAGNKLIQFILTGFLQASTASVLKLPQDRNLDSVAELDYPDDPQAHKVNQQTFLARISSSITLATCLQPRTACLLGQTRLLHLLSVKLVDNLVTSPVAPYVTPWQAGFIQAEATRHGWMFGRFSQGQQHIWVACMEATATCSDAIANGVRDSGCEEAQLEMLKLMRQSFEVIIHISEPILQAMKALILRIFFALYIVEPRALDVCVKTLGDMIANSQPNTIERYRACTSLSSIFRRLSAANLRTIGRFCEVLCGYARQMSVNPGFLLGEKIQLVDSSLACVLILEPFEQKVAYTEMVLHPVIEILKSKSVTDVLQSPLELFNFLSSGSSNNISQVHASFIILENASQKIVRPAARANSPIGLPGILSSSIAPNSIEVCCMLIKSLHGLYNNHKFPLDDAEGMRKTMLLPTSKELTFLLNLDSREQIEKVIAMDAGKPAANLQFGSVGEQRSVELLRTYGVEPPNPAHSGLREMLKDLRRSCNEIVRASILSGVSKSSLHMGALLSAICSDYQYMEPVHLVGVVSRVLQPMFSYQVASACPEIFEIVGRSEIPAVLKHIRNEIESCQKEKVILSDSPTLDMARDHGRKLLSRAVADMIAGMFPRVAEKTKDGEKGAVGEYCPAIFAIEKKLGLEMGLLWLRICNDGYVPNILDQGATRICFNQVVAAVEMCPQSAFWFFGLLLHASLRTAVLNCNASAEDSVGNYAISAMLAIIRKWPKESMGKLGEEIVLNKEKILKMVETCIVEIASNETGTVKRKKHRAIIRSMVEKIAEAEGRCDGGKKMVEAVPEKLKTVNPMRKARLKHGHDDVLAEHALDSLFGDGDPL